MPVIDVLSYCSIEPTAIRMFRIGEATSKDSCSMVEFRSLLALVISVANLVESDCLLREQFGLVRSLRSW